MNDTTSKDSAIAKLLEGIRIFGTAIGFYLVYDAYDAKDMTDAIRLLTLTLGLGMCGTCAIESLFFAKATAREKGYDLGDDRISPYQRQNALWFVAGTITAVFLALTYPASKPAHVGYVILISTFFGLSAINHAYETVRHGNMTWQNLNRPFLFATLIAAAAPVIMKAM